MRAGLLIFPVAALGAAYLTRVAVRILLGDALWLFGGTSDALGADVPSAAGTLVEDFPLLANASETYFAAARALQDGEYTKALEELEGCRHQEAACQGILGEMHLIGAGVPRNLTEAMRLLAAAADQGDADSQYALGLLYSNLVEEGPAGAQRQEALGVLHLYAASVAGHPGALMAMGYRHSQGIGVPKTCNTAALNYIEVARRVADVYSSGMPQAVELVRLGVDGKDRKAMTASEVSLFVEIAASGDANVAAAVGKRYLLGIEGFRQNYQRAAHHLQMASDKKHGGAMALLGYMYCLGLGVAKSMDVAYSYFVAAAAQDDATGHNGLGYIHFHGTEVQAKDLKLAFKHFNTSAYAGSADGMFNLASLYLTGTGTETSLQRAALWYTQAIDRGHTPATYTLAVMHLNGVGTVRNCRVAVELLKRVCERGSWVSRKLQEAYDQQRDGRNEAAALLFLKLAEGGHEVAQMNLAHLLDTGSSFLLLPENTSAELGEEARSLARIHAQRHYELSAEQGNAMSELRLGDYAYYGWGLKVEDGEEEPLKLDGEDASGDPEEGLNMPGEPKLVRQEVDVELSLAHYKRTAGMRRASDWMQPFVARASFNLGYMHQFGIGVLRDVPLARRYYHRCVETDPAGVQTPVVVMLLLLTLQAFWRKLPPGKALAAALVVDLRTHILLVHLVIIGVLLWLRGGFARSARRPSA